jgi:hypothetical protein
VYDALASTRKDIRRATMGAATLEEVATPPDDDERAARAELAAFNQRLDSPGVEYMDPSLVPPEGVTLRRATLTPTAALEPEPEPEPEP